MDEKRKQALKWLAGVGAASTPVIGGVILTVILVKRRRARRRSSEEAESARSDKGSEVKVPQHTVYSTDRDVRNTSDHTNIVKRDEMREGPHRTLSFREIWLLFFCTRIEPAES